LVGALLIVSVTAAAAPEQVLQNWETGTAGQTAGPVIVNAAPGGTLVRIREGVPGNPTKVLAIDYDFGPDLHNVMRQAESAKLQGCGSYPEPQAAFCNAVGNFGKTAGDSITFENVTECQAVTIFYNTPTGKQCGLYANDKRVATLNFPGTGDWHSPFSRFTWGGSLSGKIKLQTDAEDVARNKDFCINVDQVIFAAVKSDPWLAIEIGLSEVPIDPRMDFFNLAIQAPYLAAYDISLVDTAGAEHGFPRQDHWRAGYWAHPSRRFDMFVPPIVPGQTRFKAMKLQLSRRGLGGRGTVYVDDIKLTQGWPNNPPGDCPLERSSAFSGVVLTGRHAEYTDADTWYPSWASDGTMYSPYTDGTVEGVFSRSDNLDAVTGMAKIEGDDPLRLKVSTLGLYASSPWPYASRYPSASLVYNGVWYYGTYIINADLRPVSDSQKTAHGPFVGFRCSRDYGKTWTETSRTPLSNLFGEVVDKIPGGYSKIKMCTPHMVDFGRNMEHSPDGKAYLVAHGNVRPDSEQYWLRGDEIYLARVKPSPEIINDPQQWEFFCGYDQHHQPMWTSRFADIRPMFTWNDNAGCVTITYNAPLKKYFMVVSWGWYGGHPFDTYILESDTVSGPWKLVTYMEQFGRQAYFVNIPSKFISADGLTMWLCYSANWTGHQQNPPGGRYAMNLQEIKLLPPTVVRPTQK